MNANGEGAADQAMSGVGKMVGGASQLASKPFQGAIEDGAAGAAKGVAKGLAGTMKGATEGTAEILGAVGTGLMAANNVLNEDLLDTSAGSSSQVAQTMESMKPSFLKNGGKEQKATHLGTGLMKGMMGFSSSVYDGVTGIVAEPMKGLKAEEGKSTSSKAFGFAKGLAKGIGGAVLKPTAGACDLASSTLTGLANTPSVMYKTAKDKGLVKGGSS